MADETHGVMDITADLARQFALMLQGGMPAIDAIRYFVPGMEEQLLPGEAQRWMRSHFVSKAILFIQGKTFQDMTLEEKIKYTLDLHYSQIAYYLYSRNYSELNGADRQKADICRSALEAKAAGTAGTRSPISDFWDDVRLGRVKLGQAGKIAGTIQ